jgi:hypothetical protein
MLKIERGVLLPACSGADGNEIVSTKIGAFLDGLKNK